MTDLPAVTEGASQRTLRDLIALSVLPAVWHGLEPQALSQSMVDVLWSTLELDLVYLRLELSSADSPTEIARSNDQGAPSEVGAMLARVLAWEDREQHILPNPLEVCRLRVARWPVHWRGGRMLIAVARYDEAFPMPQERMVLSVIANYAKAALQRGAVGRLPLAGKEILPKAAASGGPASERVGVSVRRGLAPWQVKRVTAFMCDHLDEDIGLDDLAAVVNLSRFHFCKAFRLATGETPHEWFTAERMRRARELLADPSASIADIALTVGYKTPSAFSAVFRRTVGMTPSEYRRQR